MALAFAPQASAAKGAGRPRRDRRRPPPRVAAVPVETAPPEAAAKHATLRNGAAVLRLHPDGLVQLLRTSADGPALPVTSARCTLPPALRRAKGEVTTGPWGGEVTWAAEGTGGLVSAALRVRALGLTQSEPDEEWCCGLSDGFALTLTVQGSGRAGSGQMAELKVDAEQAGDWFGGGHLMQQHWPLNRGCWEVGPHYPFDNGPHGINTLVAHHWVSTKGLLVMTDPETPYLHVGLNAPKKRWLDRFQTKSWGVGIQNFTRTLLPLAETEGRAGGRKRGDGLLRLQARDSYADTSVVHPLSDWEGGGEAAVGEEDGVKLRVALVAAADVREATRAALCTLPRPSSPPHEESMAAPIWTTWARYKAAVSQEKVLKYADEITSRGMTRSVMEIDDRWQSAYGDLEFEPAKFPDPAAMVDELHSRGFKVTLWVMPFVARDSEAHQEAAAAGYLVNVRNKRGELVPGLFPWWNSPMAAALDVTNPEAVEWFVRRLRSLQTRYGVDGFKFDAGEPCFLPARFETHAPMSHPSEYTRLWVERVAANFDVGEVRTGYQTQGVPMLTRMGDRFSEWGVGNGLQSLIPTLLTSGLLGYPFCLPDMIGGNAYFGRKPDKELLVRWAQANALMPAIQFSLAPWDFSAEAQALCKAALGVREQVLETLMQQAREACAELEPICRPLWWLDPHDEQTWQIDDQFAIGEELIVAPVVVKGQRKRDVYLTQGVWRDLVEPEVTYEGGRWLRALDAPLHKLPAFQRIG